MTYEELKKIAQPHIRKTDNLPSNALLLLTQLHVPYRTEKQCREDFKGKYNPLDSYPAFLYIDEEKNKTMYFNISTRYYNFYIFHEIAHYILGHEDNSPQNEIDANLLACILAAPAENLPTYLKTAEDLSSLCQIPIDKAEMYWQEIKSNFSKWYKKTWVFYCIAGTIILSTIFLLSLTNFPTTANNIEETNKTTSAPNVNTYNQDALFYTTTSGTHYHAKDCKHIKYKNNSIPILKEEASKFNLEPCGDCM